MSNQFLQQFFVGDCEPSAAPMTTDIQLDLDQINELYMEVSVLRDANAALAKDRDRLLLERDELRAALKRRESLKP